jgi:hypothetical protein
VQGGQECPAVRLSGSSPLSPAAPIAPRALVGRSEGYRAGFLGRVRPFAAHCILPGRGGGLGDQISCTETNKGSQWSGPQSLWAWSLGKGWLATEASASSCSAGFLFPGVHKPFLQLLKGRDRTLCSTLPTFSKTKQPGRQQKNTPAASSARTHVDRRGVLSAVGTSPELEHSDHGLKQPRSQGSTSRPKFSLHFKGSSILLGAEFS